MHTRPLSRPTQSSLAEPPPPSGGMEPVHSVPVILGELDTAAAQLNAHTGSGTCCPLCSQPLMRMHRTVSDRILSLIMPVHRYRCYNFRCNWEGVLQVSASHAAKSQH